MQTRTDIVVIGPDQRLKAVVEIKNSRSLSPQDGQRQLDYMNGNDGSAPYYLLVSQERGYAWKNATHPALEFPMDSVLRRYYKRIKPGEWLLNSQLELIVSHWLFELSTGWQESTGEPETSLASIGFLDAVRRARVHFEALT